MRLNREPPFFKNQIICVKLQIVRILKKSKLRFVHFPNIFRSIYFQISLKFLGLLMTWQSFSSGEATGAQLHYGGHRNRRNENENEWWPLSDAGKGRKEGAAENFTAPTFVGRGNNFIAGAENVGYSRQRISTRRFN